MEDTGSTSDILIAACTERYIEEWARVEAVGYACHMETSLQEDGVQSPPEQLFFCAWHALGLDTWATIFPQHEIGPYRVDFLISPIGHFVDKCFPERLLQKISGLMQQHVVEIDGFEWHDKTPQQAERDRRRERFIQQQGYRVWRFAAREVLNNPNDCVKEFRQVLREEVQAVWARLELR